MIEIEDVAAFAFGHLEGERIFALLVKTFHRLEPDPRPHLLQGLQREETAAFVLEHRVEDVALTGVVPSQFARHALERIVRMCEGLGHPRMRLAQAIIERARGIVRRAYDDEIDETADGVVEAGVRAAFDRHADRDVVPAGDRRQQCLVHRQEERGRRDAQPGAECAERGACTCVERTPYGAGAACAAGIADQAERRCGACQRALPISPRGFSRVAGDECPFPAHEVIESERRGRRGDRHGNGRMLGCAGVGGAQRPQEGIHRTAVEGDVVDDDEQHPRVVSP